jgi:hypothetical protein
LILPEEMTIKITAKRLRLHTLRGRDDVSARPEFREPTQVTTPW